MPDERQHDSYTNCTAYYSRDCYTRNKSKVIQKKFHKRTAVLI